MPTFTQYSQSPLHTGITQLLANLETIKKCHHYTAQSNQQERMSCIYLDNLYETITALHLTILPLFSEGNYPGLMNTFKLIKFKGLIDELKKNIKPNIEGPIDYEITRSLVLFINDLPHESLTKMAPFLNTNIIPDIRKKHANKFLNMDLFGAKEALQTDLRLKRTTLHHNLNAYEHSLKKPISFTDEIPKLVAQPQHDGHPGGSTLSERPSVAVGHSAFFSKKPSNSLLNDIMTTNIEPHSPHTPTIN